MILINPPIRNDKHGLGHYHAPRGDRLHNGVDYECPEGSYVMSHVSGEVSKIGFPYTPIENPQSEKDKLKNRLRYVEIISGDGIRHRFFYVDPVVDVYQRVEVGQPIGIIQKMYLDGMKEHLHYECKKDGKNIDPRPYL